MGGDRIIVHDITGFNPKPKPQPKKKKKKGEKK
jgi:hypothetical protein